MAKCNYCKKKLLMNKGGPTSQLLRHLKDYCPCSPLATTDKKQSVLTVEKGKSNCEMSITSFKYDHAKVREAAAHMILVHEYPFNMMEHEFFNRFMKVATPYYQKISRATAKNDCMATYEMEKKKLKTVLKNVSKVSITSDFWKSGQQIGYMCLTEHYIESDWKLQKKILSFCDVPPPHTGLVISDAIFKCLIEWGIDNKVSTVTFDNASNNDAAIRSLKAKFSLKRKLFFSGRIFHVRCGAHIVNLMVQDGLTEIKNLIENIRESVKYLNASEARLLMFSEIVKQLQLPSKKLILDVPTRWNATYAMLAVALQFKDVFPMYQDKDPSYRWLPSLEDWKRTEEVCQFLEVFQEVTDTILGNAYPMSNLFLPEVWKINQVLIEKSIDGSVYMCSMANKMKEKFDKYWGECNLLMVIAVVLDPRYKMVLIKFAFPKIYSEDEALRNINLVSDYLHELFNEYVADHASANSDHLAQVNTLGVGTTGTSATGTPKFKPKGRSEFDQFVRRIENIQPQKTDLDIYLEEGVFRILSMMAADILSIPITTVASEAAFSIAGRVIDPYRASLSTKTVEALICGGDWIRSLYGVKEVYTEWIIMSWWFDVLMI